MRVALLTLLLAGAASAQVVQPGPVIQSPGYYYAYAAPYAWFEFAPESGAGMGTECACTTPTGAKGEAVTYTRSGSAYCTKSNKTTGLVSGDMVLCTANQPRVMRASASSPLGLLSESARTNLMLRHAEVDDAAWAKEQDSAPRTATVTANYAAAPDGTMTADRVQFPATTGAQYTDYYQAGTAGSGTEIACSVYVRGTSGSGTMDVCQYNGAAWACTDCAFVTASFTRCTSIGAAGVGTGRYCKFGNVSNQNGGVARGASDVVLWGHQGEGAEGLTVPSSLIPTTSAAVARGADAPSTDASAWPIDATGCFGATVSSAGGGAGLAGALLVDSQVAATSGALLSVASSTSVQAEDAPATAVATLSSLTFSASTDYRVWGGWDGTNWTAAQDATTDTTASALGSGAHSNATEFCTPPTSGSYLCSKVMADSSPTRCR